MSGSNLLEAANRAEATALLIRSNYRVYRPEADTQGEDLVVRRPNGDLIAVQQKGRVHVERDKYGGKNIWMLFPSRPFDPQLAREWFLIPHDELFNYLAQHHGHAPTWAGGKWTIRSPTQHLRNYLEPFRVTGLPDTD